MNTVELSLKEKIGQRFIFGVNDSNVDCIETLIKKHYIGGVILYKRNYRDYNDMIKVIKRFKEANKDNKIPLFIAIDQENGVVNRMPKDIHVLKNIYDASKNDKYIEEYARITSLMLYQSGINMNLSPVVDIYNNSKSKVLFKRCFYNEEKIFKYGLVFLKEFQKNKVLPVIKHFPGHGVSSMDSHFIIPYVYNYKEILSRHVIPFKRLIDEGNDALMVGHIVIRKLTKMLPASISPTFITDYLRGELKYDGIIVSDEINMLKRNMMYHNIYLRKAFETDNDIILIKIKSYDEARIILNMYQEYLLKNNMEDKLDNNIKRLVRVKEKYEISDNTHKIGFDIDEINQKIDDLNNHISLL